MHPDIYHLIPDSTQGASFAASTSGNSGNDGNGNGQWTTDAGRDSSSHRYNNEDKDGDHFRLSRRTHGHRSLKEKQKPPAISLAKVINQLQVARTPLPVSLKNP